MSAKAKRPTVAQLRDGSPWDCAERLGLGYVGDLNPFDHGGAFYSLADWRNYGYAECVLFEQANGRTLVRVGVINRPNDMAAAFKCCDVPPGLQGEAAAQIEASLAYSGAETFADFCGEAAEWFASDKESAAWRFAAPHILNLEGGKQ